MAKKKTPDLLDAACAAIAEDGWRGFRLSALAAKLDIDTVDMYDRFPHRTAIVAEIGRVADKHVRAAPRPELDALAPRERLFELVMRRLDALQPYKPALRRIAGESSLDPHLMSVVACNADRAAETLLDLVGGEWRGLRAIAAKSAVQALFARVFSRWLKDDSEDGAATMAELDKRSRQLSRLVELAGRASCRRRRRASEPVVDEQAA